ncbi:MAG: imelysin family protein [Pseudomonadota bacterium]
MRPIGTIFAMAAATTIVSAGASISARATETQVAGVLKTYADIAEANYSDALTGAKSMRAAINELIANPTPKTLEAARTAWIDARVPYMQTEAFRFGNKIVDDWEGKVNAWPLDEGLIDYVDGGAYGDESDENDFYTVNVIANPVLKVGGETIDATAITKTLLEKTLHEAGGIEANVATGYHAVEFLLWGQDLNGTGPGAGNRPATDFDPANCTGGNCERRITYLKTVTDLLIDDLEWITKQWASQGEARLAITEATDKNGLRAIFTGLGSLSYGELAGERIKLGLMLHDPEEEHDCFADNTHNSHFYNAVGMRNIYTGAYTRTDGTTVEGPSISDLVKAQSADTDAKILQSLDATTAAMQTMKTRAETTERYDQMIGQGNKEGNAVVLSVVNALISQARELERGIAVLNLEAIAFEGSDSLDAPDTVGAE